MHLQPTTLLQITCIFYLSILANCEEISPNSSAACVARALASCEPFAKSYNYVNVSCSLSELKSLLQEVKCDEKEATNSSSLVESSDTLKVLLQEVNSLKRESENNVVEEFMKNITNSLAEIQELKASMRNFFSEQSEIKEIKAILYEVMLRSTKGETKSSAEQYNLKNCIISYNDFHKLKLLTVGDRNKVTVNDSSKLPEIAEEKNENTFARNSSKCPSDVQGKEEINFMIPGNRTVRPKNCQELRDLGMLSSGIQTVYPHEKSAETAVIVFCDQITDGGGWTVFQNRDALPTRENFYRGWNDYVKGFGEVNGEYWLGLDNLHSLVQSTPMELRVDLVDYECNKRWAKYGIFSIGDASSKYILRIGNYSGDAGDSLGSHDGMWFSAYDQDNDRHSSMNCAERHRGAWWLHHCHSSNLNGFQYVGKHLNIAAGINWNHFRGWDYSLKKASMKVRPVSI